jgi:SAM-dependent methyltransferase
MKRAPADQSDDETGRHYLRIVRHYEDCFRRYGDTHLGVDWPNAADAELRYRVMLDLVLRDGNRPQSTVDLLDFGCGAGHFLQCLRARSLAGLRYHGIDLSDLFVSFCRAKFPGVPFGCLDVLAPGAALAEFDYVVANGVFTERCGLTFDEMLSTFQAIVGKLWAATRCGLAFNVMSSHVDWERDDLFHLPMDSMAAFVTGALSRHFVIRMDYGLREYTVYVYRWAVR